jgi:SH3-like domain-containing protein
MRLREWASRAICVGAVAMALVVGGADTVPAQGTAPQVTMGPSGLPLPRFVTLRSARANLRVGPGTDYAVLWQYVRSGLPLEIIQEYDNWRRVRDSDGTEGWVNQSLLSGNRTGAVAPWEKGKKAALPLHAEPNDSARVVARLEPGLIGIVRTCDGEWCQMEFSGVRGWIRQSRLWGVYPGELYRS